jgi:hypothetical protein
MKDNKKTMIGYQNGGDISKGLLRRYNRHLSPESHAQNAVQQVKGAMGAPTPTPTTPTGFTPEGTTGAVERSTAGGVDQGYVTTKNGATVFQANPGKGPMITDKSHMKRTIQLDRKAGWSNFLHKFGGKKKVYSSF